MPAYAIDVPTVFLRSVMQQSGCTCSPGDVTWLSRSVMSAGMDRRLPREHGAGIRFAAGRWQLFNAADEPALHVALKEDLSAAHVAVIARLANLSQPAPAELLSGIRAIRRPIVRAGTEFDLHSGSWVLALGPWIAVLDVDGQPRRDSSHAPQLGGDSELTVKEQRYPVLEAGAHKSALDWLTREQDPGVKYMHVLAYHWREAILGVKAGADIPDIEVAIAFDTLSDRPVEIIKRSLLKRLWPNGPRASAEDAKRYAIDELLTVHDVYEAQDIVNVRARAGRDVSARARFAQNDAKRRRSDSAS